MEGISRELIGEEQFGRCLNRLRRELNSANWHFEIYKSLKEAKKDYLKELNQAAPFWGLTIDAHALLTLVLLNRFFDKEDSHLSLEILFSLVVQNLYIFSDERFSDRLKKADRFDHYIVETRYRVTQEIVQSHRQTIHDLPMSGLRTWRNKLLSHIDIDWVVLDKDIRKTVSLNDTHIQKIIDTLDNILNFYHGAYDSSTWVKDLPLKNEIENVFDLIQKGFVQRKKLYGLTSS